MSVNHKIPCCLNYGADRRFTCEIDSDRLVELHATPQPKLNLADDLRELLERPLEFPPLEQAIVPGDHVVLALEWHTPEAAAVVAQIWDVLERRSVAPQDVVILQPATFDSSLPADPRSQLPAEIRPVVRWAIHDPTEAGSCRYLASTSTGERVYLAREIVDADFVVPVGQIGFHPLLGYRGTSSVFYPGLSNIEALARTRGQGHSELGPDDDRPLRLLVDEIAWLLGVQFSVQVIASAGGGACRVLAGACDAVLRRGRRELVEQWLIRLDDRPDIVVAAIDSDAGGHGWEQFGAALATARNLVAADGKIVILSDIREELGDGLRLLRDARSPRAALKPLREQAPLDVFPATQLASAADWANVYLMSGLAPDMVEELFMVPLEKDREVERLLESGDSCVVVGAAQHSYGIVESS